MQPSLLPPAGLRTEYRVDPLGVDTRAPRLSWELVAAAAGRNLAQTAYQILVAGEPARLAPATADLWNSGEVESAETVHLPYAGATLLPRQRCWWKVRVRDQGGAWSDWSAPARWTMGLLQASDWHARWVGTGESLPVTVPPRPCANTLRDPWLRKEFTLEAAPLRATAFVASIGFHELYVNGVRAGDAVLVPNVTDNSQRARYVAYEIGPLLRPGPNVLGLWLGAGWSIFAKFVTADKPRAPIVLGQFELDLPDGRALRIVTDESWHTHPSPNRLIGTWDFRHFGGEHYDGREDIPGWAEPGVATADWRPAVVFHPAVAVSADSAESNVLAEELHPVAVEPAGDCFRFDFGRNFSGWIELTVAGQPGDWISIQHSERANQAMTHGLHSTYVIGPAGRGVFRHRFNYCAGRWVQVHGLREAPGLADLRGWVVRPAFAPASGFACAVPRLNDIHATALWTFENLTLGGYVVDCPHRERMGYGGDAYATTTTGLGAYRLGAFYSKWAEDWRDVQDRKPTWGIDIPPGEPGSGGLEAGNLPYTAPTYWGGGGPAWSGYCVHLPWEVYRQYGDEQILHANFGMIERWLAFLETKAEGDLLVRYGGHWDFLGDWLWAGTNGTSTNGDTRETLFFNNCCWIYNLQVGAAIARIVGRPDLGEEWTRRAGELRQKVHARFFNAADASYANGFQAYLAIALLTDVPPPELRPAVWRRLEHEIRTVCRGHIHAGITGGAFLFQLLMEAGRDDLIRLMVDRDDAPGWGAMLREGATTFWESWEPGADSRLHSSFLFVGAWFVHGVLGLKPDGAAPGFRRCVIRPRLAGAEGLRWARGHYDSVRGRFAVAWRCEDDAFEIDVELPPNTTARLHLPVAELAAITEGGRPLTEAAGVRSLGTDADAVETVVELASGRFQFRCARSPAAAFATHQDE